MLVRVEKRSRCIKLSKVLKGWKQHWKLSWTRGANRVRLMNICRDRDMDRNVHVSVHPRWDQWSWSEINLHMNKGSWWSVWRAVGRCWTTLEKNWLNGDWINSLEKMKGNMYLCLLSLDARFFCVKIKEMTPEREQESLRWLMGNTNSFVTERGYATRCGTRTTTTNGSRSSGTRGYGWSWKSTLQGSSPSERTGQVRKHSILYMTITEEWYVMNTFVNFLISMLFDAER